MNKNGFTISVIIPTYNAERYIISQIMSLIHQTIEIDEIIIIDSSSSDKTRYLASIFGAKVLTIAKNEFNHGSTRKKAAKISKGDILIFMTQDAIPVNEYSIENLIKPLIKDILVGVSFGRQIPYNISSPFAKHLRYFNYPERSYTRKFSDRNKYGVKTCFVSNSFAAYKRTVLQSIDWFKDGIVLGEDVYAAAMILLKGYKIAYVAESLVFHSHNYNMKDELKRYFEIGRFHGQERWIVDTFGKSSGEGKKFVISEIKFLIEKKLYKFIPLSVTRNMLKFVYYKAGFLKK